MAKDGTKDTDVVASTVAHAKHRFGSSLIGNANPWRKVLVVGAGIASEIDTLLACNPRFARYKVNPATQARASSRFGKEEFPTEPVVKGEFGSDAPSVLAVEE